MENTPKKGFRQWLIKVLTPKPVTQGVISDEMRERALALRRAEHALKQKEKEVEMLDRILSIETKMNPKESSMDMMIRMAMPILLQKLGGGTGITQPQINSQSQGEIVYTPIDVKNLLANNPKLKQIGSRLSDEQIREYLIQQQPNMSKDSIDMIIKEVRA